MCPKAALCCWIVLSTWLSPVCCISLSYTVEEEVPPGTVLGNILEDSHLDQQYDPDTISRIRLAVLGGHLIQYFTIPLNSRDLQTSHVLLDREDLCAEEADCTYKLDIVVMPVEYFQVISVNITVLDINDNAPHFLEKKTVLQIPENTAADTSFLLPIATDADSGRFGAIQYSLVPQVEQFSLQILSDDFSPYEVRLVLHQDWNREGQSHYHLQLLAEDSGPQPRNDSHAISIEVLDTNDNYPVFSQDVHTAYVPEEFPLFETIMKVEATDMDTGLNGEILYIFSEQTNDRDRAIFYINQTTGDIILLKGLDYEEQTSHVLTVIAHDLGPDPVPVSTRVVINVLNVNDVAPSLIINTLTATGQAELLENTPAGEFIAHISVHDPDDEPNAEITCTLNSAQFALVEIYHNEFKVISEMVFDREVTTSASIVIVCSDSGNPPLNSSQTLVVDILDVNDNVPVFTQGNYTTSVPENSDPSTPVFHVSATDRDFGPNADVTYALETQDYVQIDPISGLVSTQSRLDYEMISQFAVRVFASDHGSPSLTATATIRVIVDDVNDEVPQFSQDSYLFRTYENQPVRTEIGRVVASDADSGIFGKIRFTLVSDNSADDFLKVHPKTGRISTKAILDREHMEILQLVVVATDSAPPYYNSNCTVTILVTDKNDNAPSFVFPAPDSNTLRLSVFTREGTLVYQVQATDPDLGQNSLLSYSLAEGNDEGYYGLDSETGLVTLEKALPGSEQMYTLLIAVHDHGDPQQSSVTTLYIITNSSFGVLDEADPTDLLTTMVHPTIVGQSDDQTMEVTIIIVVAILSLVLMGCLVVLLVYIYKRQQQQNAHPTKQTGVVDSYKGDAEIIMTPILDSERLDQIQPLDTKNRINMWIQHYSSRGDSGHGSWSESGSDCGTSTPEGGSHSGAMKDTLRTRRNMESHSERCALSGDMKGGYPEGYNKRSYPVAHSLALEHNTCLRSTTAPSNVIPVHRYNTHSRVTSGSNVDSSVSNSPMSATGANSTHSQQMFNSQANINNFSCAMEHNIKHRQKGNIPKLVTSSSATLNHDAVTDDGADVEMMRGDLTSTDSGTLTNLTLDDRISSLGTEC